MAVAEVRDYSQFIYIRKPVLTHTFFFFRTQDRFDQYRCLSPRNESSLKLIGDVCSATILLDLVQKGKATNARFLGKKIVRNIPVKGWRICKTETAVDFWLVLTL